MWRPRATRLLSLTCTMVFAGTLLLTASSTYSQTLPTPTPPESKRDKDDLGADIGSHESEMRAKLALRAEKKSYDENLARARETSEIASQLRDAFQTRKAFNGEDGKKLERMEKLTKRIRNEAGGMETDVQIEIPPTAETAVKLVAEMAEDLRKEVEKTPRHVISTTVIDQANKLLELIQYVRDLNR